MMRAGWLLVLATLAACHGTPDVVTLHISGVQLTAAEIAYAPRSNVASARLDALGWLTIERKDSTVALTVTASQLCPVTVPAGKQLQPAALRAVIELPAALPPLGFDSAFTLQAKHACPERGRGQITWRQLEGPPLSELVITQAGFQLRARTASLSTAHPEPLPAGIVPISPRTQGRVLLEASWRGPGDAKLRRTVDIRATARATGLSSVAVSQQLVLSSSSWQVTSAPQGGHARVHASGEHALFTPDAMGRWTLADAEGRALALQALWHDKTPYDCGRSECHAEIAQTTLDSPMSHALERALPSPDPAAISCMLDCHVLGERGLGDGGFLDVAHELGWSPTADMRWNELPRALRRLGGVRCTACHGPGAIPEPDARARVLRSDVCATCHDAPPRYVHVAQWRASRMSRADAQVSTRAGACANCHTTAGFLAAIGARAPRAAPPDPEPAGIACAACHAPHAKQRGPHLVRALESSALCQRCHAPVAGELQPAASSAALWAGGASIPGVTQGSWQKTQAPSAHGGIAGGCIGCHGANPGGKLDHSFQVQPRVCGSCHAGGAPVEAPNAAGQSIRQRAAQLEERLRALCRATTHADLAADGCSTPQLTRARYEVDLVRQDPAAGIHNAVFARQLLDDAEKNLN